MHVLCACVCVCAGVVWPRGEEWWLTAVTRGQCSHIREGILGYLWRQQNWSQWSTYSVVLIGFAMHLMYITHKLAFYNVLILLQVLRYTTSWTARPNHNSLYSVPLPTSSPQCPPSVSRSSSHCFHSGRGLEDVAEREAGSPSSEDEGQPEVGVASSKASNVMEVHKCVVFYSLDYRHCSYCSW